MDVRSAAKRAAQQHGCIAWRQLRELGWTDHRTRWQLERGLLQVLHDGVFAFAGVPPSADRRRTAATLTAPGTHISHLSAASAWEMGVSERSATRVTRQGDGGPRFQDGVWIHFGRLRDDEVTTLRGIPITTPVRTIIDVAGRLRQPQVDRLVREALRHGLVDELALRRALVRYRGRRGMRRLRFATDRWGAIPARRAKSDAEVLAHGILLDAGLAPDRINVRVGGEEADLVFDELALIIELDGPRNHFALEDARKDAAWRAAGYEVVRLCTDVPYDDPARLLASASERRSSRQRTATAP